MKMTSVIFTKKADALASAAYVQELIKHNGSAFGAAYIDEGVIDMMKQDAPLQLTQFEEIQTQTKEFPLVAWAATTDGAIAADDIQPFTAIEKADGNPACIVFLSGDFTKFAEKDSIHTDAWLAYQKRVLPKIMKEYKLAGGEAKYPEFVKALDEQLFREEIAEVWGKNGTITLVHFTGEITSYMDQDNYLEFPWGTTSDHYGFTEAVAKEEPKKTGVFGFRKKPAAVAVAAAPAATAPAAAVAKGTSVPEFKAPETNNEGSTIKGKVEAKVAETKVVSGGDGKKMRIVQCPPNINGKKDIRQYYEDNLPTGVAPNGYRQKPRIEVPIEDDGKNGADAVAAAAVTADADKERVRAPAQAKAVADVKSLQQKGEDGLPILTSKQKQDLNDFIVKAKLPPAFTDNNGEIPSQETLDNIEQEIPSFAEQSGTFKSLRDTFGLKYINLVNMGYASPEGLASLCINYRDAMFQNMRQNGTLPKAGKKEETFTEVPEKKVGFKRKA